ncbi:SAV_2336 N-terminal domain-related protein [Micromonospora sp. NPDC049203]|uniref:SAV_2336 N-terminal domain-related protein n=1 Tax=Micromonospora sp. NPDC049203 TaxID=3364267 RepID=UPI0037140FAE
MTIERLRAAITAVGGAPTARDLAEVLWLSHHLGPAAPVAAPPPAPAVGPPGVDAEPAAPGAPAPARPSEPPAPAPAPPPSRPATTPLHAAPAAPGTIRAGEITVPQSASLGDRLGLQRTLRPLTRRVPSPRQQVLDEEATVRVAAEHLLGGRPWPAVMVPATERWLDLAVVVDSTASMTLWRELAGEVVDTLAAAGVFRRVAQWRLDRDDAGRARLSTWRGDPRTGAELVDPSGRRVILVVSDCVDRIWHTGAAGALLHRWARRGPVAVLQPLPERMWSRTGSRTTPGLLSTPRPGAPNSDLRFEPFDGSPPPRGAVVPVLEIDSAWFGRWTRLVAGAPAVTAAVTAVTGEQRDAVLAGHGGHLPPSRRVRQFRSSSSPEAVELAAYVAMSEPVLPVIRYIQQAMFRRATPSQLAEVLLSGLLRVVDARTGRYAFVEGVQPLLLDTLSRPKMARAAELLEHLSRTVQSRMGVARTHFTALTPGPGHPGFGPDSRPFAVVNLTARARLDRAGTPLAGASTPRPAPDDDAGPLATPDPAPGSAPADGMRDLLSPWRRAVRCTGRDRELAELRRWVDLPGPSLRVVTGGPGVGKTRLLVELIAQLDAAPVAEGHTDGRLVVTLAGGGELVVIDEAETRPGTVRRELARADRVASTHLLLITRAAGDWWQELRRTGPSRLVGDATVDRLDPPWRAGPPRQSALREALRGLSQALDAAAGTDRWREHGERMRLPDVGDDRYATPLSLHIVALRMLVRTLRAPAPVTPEDLTAAHATRERRYWEDAAVAAQISYARPGELDRYVAAATLYGAATARDAQDLISRLRPDMATDRPTLHRLANWLHELYPGGPEGYWTPVTPDDLRSEIVVPAVLAHPDLVTGILADRSADQVRRAMQILGPGCHRHPRLVEPVWRVVRGHPPLLLALLEQTRSRTSVLPPVLVDRLRRLVADPDTPESTLRAVADGLPDPAALFAGQPASVSERLVAGFRRLSDRDRYLTPLADALARHRERLLAEGAADAVTDVLAEEVELRARLAQRAGPQSVDRVVRALAATLDAQTGHLARTGLTTQALSSADRAVAQYQRLMSRGSRDARGPLCAAENRRARVLADLERVDEGFEAARLAIAHGQEVVAAGAPEGDDLLNEARATLAMLHRRSGDPAAALAVENQCVRRYRERYAAEPDRHAVALARALLRQTLDLADLGAADDALATCEQAVALIGATVPAPVAEMATARHCQAMLLRSTGRADQAATVLREVVVLHRQLATGDPSRRGRDLAEVLRQQAWMLAETGPVEAAIEALTEAGDVLARLFRENPADATLRALLMANHQDLAETWDRVGEPATAERHRQRARLLREAGGAAGQPGS